MYGLWLRILIIALSGLVPMVAGGCAGRATEADLTVQPKEYEVVFDATLDALRAERFRLDRVDRRLGVITTQPKTSGSVVEPWRRDNSTFGQAVESTLNHQRRVVRIEFLPTAALDVDEVEGALAGVTPSPAPFEAISAEQPLVLSVRAIIEREHRPGRRIETVSLRDSSYATDPELIERGIARTFWEPIARDPYLETRIRKRIQQETSHSGANESDG